MNFDFSEEQELLRSEARKFLEARCPPARVRGVLGDASRGRDEALWRELVEQGWTALTLPEEHGGLGMSRTDLCVLAGKPERVGAYVRANIPVEEVRKELLALRITEQQVMPHHPMLDTSKAQASMWGKITDKLNARRKG